LAGLLERVRGRLGIRELGASLFGDLPGGVAVAVAGRGDVGSFEAIVDSLVE
jgi:hypothetical protein